jgi:F420-dependent oxidoreductase-like protein
MGLQIPTFTYDGVGPDQLFETVATSATTAERCGFDAVFVMDHFFQLPMLGRPDQNMFEAYTLLSAIAARTSTVRLGALVGGMTYRNPALLAKSVTCLDVISGGRAIWGIGAGWFQLEHESYGWEFGTFTDRFEKLEEGLQIGKSMFVNDTTTFEGKWFQVHDAYNVPKPVQPVGPPILIGGSGERKTLRMVAQYGDACNVFGDPTTVRHLMDVLDEHCARLDRDPSTICRTRLGTLVVGRTQEEAEAKVAPRLGGARFRDLPADAQARFTLGDPSTVQERVQELLDAGLDGLIFNLVGVEHPDVVEEAAAALRPVLG